MKKRNLLVLAAASIAAVAYPLAASATDFPTRPITLVVGAAPGGPTDIMARLMAREMGEFLKQPIVVDNRPGANSLIATEHVSRSAPDGYTMLLAYNAHVANTLLMKSAKYDALKDFAPVGLAVNMPMALITAPASSFKTPQELVAAAKAKPDAVTYASSGNGSAPHLAGAMLQTQIGSSMVHVPFKGNAPAITEIMANRVDFMFYPMVGLSDFIAQNRVRLIGVTAAQRLTDHPNVPTLSESGQPGFEQTSPWIGMFAPARTPPEVVAKVTAAMQSTLNKPEIKERMRQLGAVPNYRSPTEFEAFLRADIDRWAKVIAAAGIQSN
jgi:tripartite-type tricarboxylate transporter receptor subunit TctC